MTTEPVATIQQSPPPEHAVYEHKKRQPLKTSIPAMLKRHPHVTSIRQLAKLEGVNPNTLLYAFHMGGYVVPNSTEGRTAALLTELKKCFSAIIDHAPDPGSRRQARYAQLLIQEYERDATESVAWKRKKAAKNVKD